MRHVCPECGATGDAGSCTTDGALRVPAGADELLGTTIGSWQVARLLGAGGMGRVYQAVQPAIGARVAIKVLKAELATDLEVIERFFNEARAVNLIRHENIVNVIDLGRLPDGAPYIVMEHLEGASLGTIFRRPERLPVAILARVVGDVLAALEAAHDKGIIHRDLKPDNVFVSPGGRATVLDFGVAKLARADGLAATQTGSLLGTPAYMSPEQARSQPLDARSDLYAVGVILYEGATRALPFTAGNLFDLLRLHVEATPATPRSRNPELSVALDAVIMRALEKQPGQRFGSASEMRRTLASAVEDQPAIAMGSIVIPGESTAPAVASDPLAPTAASTNQSLARGETMASTPQAPAARAVPEPLRSRRKAIAAAVVAGSLVSLGAVAIALYLGADRKSAPPVRAQASPDATPRGPVAIAPALRADPPPPDAPPPDAIPPGKRRKIPESQVNSPPQADGSYLLPGVAAFDPFASYARIHAEAEQRAGFKVFPNTLHWELDQAGHLLVGHEAHFYFISPDRERAGRECFVMVFVTAAETRIAFGTGDCHRAIAPPRCSFKQLRAKAVALGLPPDAPDPINFQHLTTTWLVSSGGFEKDLDDDCP